MDQSRNNRGDKHFSAIDELYEAGNKWTGRVEITWKFNKNAAMTI